MLRPARAGRRPHGIPRVKGDSHAGRWRGMLVSPARCGERVVGAAITGDHSLGACAGYTTIEPNMLVLQI